MPGQLISLFINKSHWSDNTCSQLLLSKQTVCVCVCVCVCVFVSSELFVKKKRVMFLLSPVAADRWLLVWSSLALSGQLWPVLPGSGLLICWPTWPCRVDWLWHALHCTASTCLWHGFFLKKPWMYCCCCPLLIFYTKFCLKITKTNFIIDITQIV